MKYIVLLLVLLFSTICSGQTKDSTDYISLDTTDISWRDYLGYTTPTDTVAGLLLVVDTVETNRQGLFTGDSVRTLDPTTHEEVDLPLRWDTITTPQIINGYFTHTYPAVYLDRKKQPLDKRYKVLYIW